MHSLQHTFQGQGYPRIYLRLIREDREGHIGKCLTFSMLNFSRACVAQSTASCCISSLMSAFLITALRSHILSFVFLSKQYERNYDACEMQFKEFLGSSACVKWLDMPNIARSGHESMRGTKGYRLASLITSCTANYPHRSIGRRSFDYDPE